MSSTPRISHLVLNVRDIEASEKWYTENLGFEKCGQLRVPPESNIDMRFYRGDGLHHHDIALVQIPDPENAPPVIDWKMFPDMPGIVHIAIDYGDRDGFLHRIKHLQDNGVEFAVRGNHGMTHSAYIVDPDGNGIEVIYDLPSEVWEDDVDAALSFFEPVARTGPESLEDNIDYPVFGKA